MSFHAFAVWLWTIFVIGGSVAAFVYGGTGVGVLLSIWGIAMWLIICPGVLKEGWDNEERWKREAREAEEALKDAAHREIMTELYRRLAVAQMETEIAQAELDRDFLESDDWERIEEALQ